MAHTYKESGIDYALMDAFKNAALAYSGNQPNLIEFPKFYLTSVLEGLGSLNKLADLVFEKTQQDYYFQVGWGNAATILNDLATVGAKALDLKLFIAPGHAKWFRNQQCWENLIAGFGNAAKFSSAIWNGGETQTLPDLVNEDSFILAGSSMGIIKPKNRLLKEEKIRAGDRIILLESSGLHTNGATFIRTNFADDLGICIDALKNKTIIYLPLINALQDSRVDIHYASHITGHGWRKIMRPQKPFVYIIEEIPKPQPIFKNIQSKTSVDDKQMYADFNMGAGFAIFAPQKSVEKILQIAQNHKIGVIDAGFIENGPRKVFIKPLNITFDSLSIR